MAPWNNPTAGSARPPSLSGRTSPQPDNCFPDVTAASLRREIDSLKAELEITKHELVESNEAREASETCVKALREFIGENNVGSSSHESGAMKLPPMPTMTHGDEPDTSIRPNGVNSGWGFKLWRGESVTTKPGPGIISSSAQNLPSTEPLVRKFGGLFSSRATTPSYATPHPRSGPHSVHQEQMHHASDSSSAGDSVVEPISPTTNDLPAVMIRRSSGSFDPEDGLDQRKNMNGDLLPR